MKLYHIGIFDNREPILALRYALKDAVKEYREISYTNYVENNKGSNLHFEHYAIMDIHEFNPDIIFIHAQSPDVLNDRLLMYLHQRNDIFKIGFSGDVRDPLPNFYIKYGNHINLSLFTNDNDVEKCRQKGVNSDFIHVGYDTNIYTDNGTVIENHPEIVFMGNNYGNNFHLSNDRKNMVDFLYSSYGSQFVVYGEGWKNIVPNSKSLMFSHYEEAMAYRSSKIAINYSHFNYSRYSSDRLNRILGCGCFCLSHNYLNIEQDFIPGKHLDIFNNLDELKQKIDYYLKDENLRKLIAKNGNKKIEQSYTYRNFADRIINFYNESGIKKT
jgi:spore maturation protein CgeB